VFRDRPPRRIQNDLIAVVVSVMSGAVKQGVAEVLSVSVLFEEMPDVTNISQFFTCLCKKGAETVPAFC
jgi:hypothetical protein